jgi:hypothetical protein
MGQSKIMTSMATSNMVMISTAISSMVTSGLGRSMAMTNMVTSNTATSSMGNPRPVIRLIKSWRGRISRRLPQIMA